MKKQVYLYAVDKLFKVVDVKFLEGDRISIRNVIRTAKEMQNRYPERVSIFAVDNRRGLRKEFMESMKSKDFTKNFEFVDTIGSEGLKII